MRYDFSAAACAGQQEPAGQGTGGHSRRGAGAGLQGLVAAVTVLRSLGGLGLRSPAPTPGLGPERGELWSHQARPLPVVSSPGL